MRPIRSLTPLAAALSLTVLLSACGGGGGGDSSSASVLPQSAVGIWQSTNSNQTSTLIVAPNGTYFMAGTNQNNCAGLSIGQYKINGTAISGGGIAEIVTYTTIPGISSTCSFPDGSTSANISFNGTVSTGQYINLTSNAVTSSGTKLSPSSDNYQWSNLNSIPPSLSTLSGNYADADNSISIKPDGSLVSTDTVTGCTVSGTISPFDNTHNVYQFSAIASGCQGSYAFENGLQFSGLAAVDNTTTPSALYLGGSATANNGASVLFGFKLLKIS